MSLETNQTSNEKIYSVEQLNSHIRALIEGQLPVVWLKGEISNFKPHTSGHFYFSVKDSKSQISAVMFRGHNSKLNFKPRDGMEVIIRGRVTVYEPRGSYQIACEMMEPVGAGALQRQFEELKNKLKAEGLFDLARKKKIPSYPKSVAVVTSPTGAAIQDILNIMNRRAKSVEVTVVPALVQGAAAAPSLRHALQQAIQLKPDVIIIGRGGGSMEDMWCFNDEVLARIIADSEIPIISAVGHEIDFTICDFVADLRAPTPSAAAELVAKSSHEIIQRIESLEKNLVHQLKKKLESLKQSIAFYKRRLIDPKKNLQDLRIRNDELVNRLETAIQNQLQFKKQDVSLLKSKLVRPDQLIQRLRMLIDKKNLMLKKSIESKLFESQASLKNLMGIMDSLSPMKVVDRGYSIVTSGKDVVKSISQVKKNDKMDIRLTDGELTVEVLDIKKLKN